LDSFPSNNLPAKIFLYLKPKKKKKEEGRFGGIVL